MTRKKTLKPIEEQYQQGDVILERISDIPPGANLVKGTILAEGEGHHVHRFAAPSDVQLYVKDGIGFVRVHRQTTVEHVMPDGRNGEHNPITVPSGDYQFGQVQEWDYLAEMAHKVID